MSEALQINIENQGAIHIAQLKGMITEDSNLDALNQIQGNRLIIDLEGIERINSYGIRRWINCLKELMEKVDELVFVKCPPVIVEQFNMISNFGAGGVVYSIFLPFYAEESDEEKMVMFEVYHSAEEDPELIVSGIKESDQSLADYEFNDLEDEYFAFLEGQKGKEISGEMLTALKQLP